jgi:hypothetical protein
MLTYPLVYVVSVPDVVRAIAASQHVCPERHRAEPTAVRGAASDLGQVKHGPSTRGIRAPRDSALRFLI